MSVPCPNCGRVNRPGARYCASCQTPLSASAARLQPGQLLDGGAYRVVRPLGKGGMGAVWLVAQTKAFDRLAVLKEVLDYFDPSDARERKKALQRFEAEARTLGDLRHPGIPDLYAYFTEGGHNYLVMEYIEGTDLRQGLTGEDPDTGQLRQGGPMPLERVLGYTIEICEVLEYLAGRQPPVIHNDIKPGNIIVDKHSGRAVLVDFGTAKTRYVYASGQPDGARASVYGTVGYAAPELYRGQSEPRSDVYSLAATAYHLLTDDDPRDHPSQYPQLGALPPRLADTLRAALAEDLGERLTAGQLRGRLQGYLAGESAPVRALTFPGGEVANSRGELVALAVKHWQYTAGLLQDGTLVRWLRGTLRDPIATQAGEEALRQWPNDADAALDAFLRRLDPSAVQPGAMELRTTNLLLPAAGAGQRVRQAIEVANRGRGYLRGEILSSQPWVSAGSGRFACAPGLAVKVPVQIDTTGLDPDKAYLAAITLMPVSGPPEVVPVQVTVRLPAISVEPAEVDLGRVQLGQSTPVRDVAVTNTSLVIARCRVHGVPTWLHVRPDAFVLQPGGRQDVEFVGRADNLERGRHEVDVTVILEGGQDRRVRVELRVRGGLFG